MSRTLPWRKQQGRIEMDAADLLAAAEALRRLAQSLSNLVPDEDESEMIKQKVLAHYV